MPAFSGRFASSIAANAAAPELMPTRMPSRFAIARAVANASSFETGNTSSMISRSRTSGTKFAPIPWILCGPAFPSDNSGEAAGSTATTRKPGLRALST